MISFPNAKINLGLNILEKRADGFHNLESIFYPVEWTDALEITASESFHFNSTGIKVEGNMEDNLCVKVYNSLKEKFNLPPVQIHLHKIIPIGAGLGGGSSDASFTVKVLDKLFRLHLTAKEMQDLIRPFGSDCAFFIKNKPVFAFEKGDQFQNIDVDLNGKFILLIYPNIHISTKEAYESILPAIPSVRIKEAIPQGINSWKELLQNDFEAGLFAKYPVLSKLKNDLYTKGAIYASMSGSGSTVYGIFNKEVEPTNLFPENFTIWKGWLR